MKKKLLSLVLAGAMVASTSVSAFADDNAATDTAATDTAASSVYQATGGTSYDVTRGESEAEIGIEGNIANSTNHVKPSTINVTVPTLAKFTVNSSGNLIGSNINIKSQGDTKVKVIAEQFIDKSGASEINAVDLNKLNEENKKTAGPDVSINRKMVYLKLTGNQKVVSLQSENGNGICELGTTSTISREDDRVLGTVENGKDLQLKLEGSAVVKGDPLTEAVSDEFTLVLKLKKANS